MAEFIASGAKNVEGVDVLLKGIFQAEPVDVQDGNADSISLLMGKTMIGVYRVLVSSVAFLSSVMLLNVDIALLLRLFFTCHFFSLLGVLAGGFAKRAKSESSDGLSTNLYSLYSDNSSKGNTIFYFG